MNFKHFSKAVAEQFDRMKQHDLFRVKIEKDLLWTTYLTSFPEGTNTIHKERGQYDCQCCKKFIRDVGNMIAIIDGKIESIWDVETIEPYQTVADSLSKLVKHCAVDNVFLHVEKQVGIDHNFQQVGGKTITWDHFSLQLPDSFVARKTDVGTKLSLTHAAHDVLLRGLTELTTDAVETVLELVDQNSLYRGAEYRPALKSFSALQTEFCQLKTKKAKDLFVWSKLSKIHGAVASIRNTAIGTLLIDLSEGLELDQAVCKFETSIMAPSNYKRPTALVTKAQIEKAKQSIQKLGLESALERRYAYLEDITVNNILFADRNAKKKMKGDVFDDIATKVVDKKFDKVEEINIEDFLNNVLPKAKTVEILVQNRHSPNLVSLIAPVHSDAKNLFKWNNNFSWSYTGEMADSIRERVKNAGGNVVGDLRCSLSWFNYDDQDLHMMEPDGFRIYFGNKGRPSPSHGILDVDMNMGKGTTRNPVENIVYKDRNLMKPGIYTLLSNNYCKRESVDEGFEAEIEFDGMTHTVSYDKALRQGDTVAIAKIKYSRKDGFEILESLPSTNVVKDLWNVPSQSFHRVNVIMLSPNHWNDRTVGNKHYFFMIDGCVNSGKARGFFNESLSEELNEHRKVLEIVGSKMKTAESVNQLSGLGFSSTKRDSVVCRVTGSFTRVVKVLF